MTKFDRFLGSSRCPDHLLSLWLAVSVAVLVIGCSLGIALFVMTWLSGHVPYGVVIGFFVTFAIGFLLQILRHGFYLLLFLVCFGGGLACSFAAASGYHPITLILAFVCLQSLAVFSVFRAEHWRRRRTHEQSGYTPSDE